MGRSLDHAASSRARGASTVRSAALKAAAIAVLLSSTVLVGARPVEETIKASALPVTNISILSAMGTAPRGGAPADLSEDELEQIRENLRETQGTINFIRNDGQWDDSVLYLGQSLTGLVQVERDGLR